MKRFLVALLICVPFCATKAQFVTPTNALRVAVEVVYGNEKYENPLSRYSLFYNKQLSARRWMLEGGISYLNSGYARERVPMTGYYYQGNRSDRFSADFNLFFNILKNNRHALRTGLGPPVAYHRNSRPGTDLTIELTTDGKNVERVSYSREYTNAFDLGVNLKLDYEFALTNQIALGVRVSQLGSIVGTNLAYTIGSLSTAGLSVGYRF